jgi:3-isopropylmalate/(R)-2-methylmalate dehydratase small subunit
MQPFRSHTGLVAPLDRPNVDTDQIIPKQFLKRIERTGFGPFLFYDWRYLADGTPDPDFELNQERYQGASILIGGRNFGCGSSREHAVWALHDYGIKVIIAPSFADIFYNNWLGNGLLPIALSEAEVDLLATNARDRSGFTLIADVENCLLSDAFAFSAPFALDPFYRFRLLNGLDDIGLTLQQEAAIASYEQSRTGPSAAITGNR